MVSGKNAHCEFARKLVRLAALTSVVCLIGVSRLPTQGQPANEPASTNCPPAPVAKPLPLNADEISVPSESDFTSQSPLISENTNSAAFLPVLKEFPPAEKPSRLPSFDAGYGQFFPEQHLFPPHTSAEIEAPSWLYVKLSFSF